MTPKKRPQRTLGQALPEFALTLPVLMLILLIAVDFGRLAQGWVTLNNTTRIAANYAAAMPAGPFGSGSEYETTVRNESNNSPCAIATIPTPTFAPDTNVGSTATVSITCDFKLLTPFIGGLVGDPVPISATAIFTVRSGTIAGVPVPPPPPCTPSTLVVPNLVGLTLSQARTAWTGAGFTGAFNPSGSPNKVVTGQVPGAGQCRPPSQAVFVTHT